MAKFRILNNGTPKVKYTYIIKRKEAKNGFKKIISLGNAAKLEEINKNYLEIFRTEIKKINWTDDPEEMKVYLLGKLHGESVREFVINDGITSIYKIIKKLKIFESLRKSKHKNLEELLEYQIASRILNENSVIKRFQTKDEFVNSIDTKKDTFYSLLDVLVENEKTVLCKV